MPPTPSLSAPAKHTKSSRMGTRTVTEVRATAFYVEDERDKILMTGA